MTVQSGEAARQEYIGMMGEPLGSQFAELVQDIGQLHRTWFEYVELYGKRKSRVQLLNYTRSTILSNGAGPLMGNGDATHRATHGPAVFDGQ